jgi:hypothetical protein
VGAGPGTGVPRAGLLPLVEHAVKGPVWDCRMCGQCVLHDTGMTCPMTCPKTLRNGPCGGVRPDGGCEVIPEMQCVWVTACRRSRSWPLPPVWKSHLHALRPPVDNRLHGTSSWLNLLTGRDRRRPAGWSGSAPSPPSEDDLDGVGVPGASLVEVW